MRDKRCLADVPNRHCSVIHRAIVEKDEVMINDYLTAEFGVTIRYNQLREVIRRGYFDVNEVWSDGSWRMWLKNRLYEFGCFIAGGGQNNLNFRTATLHVFFISLEENTLMLARLRKPEKTEGSQTARSKIFREDSRLPEPIDTTAARVAPDRLEQ